jgi:hypothetical protein
MDDIGPRFCRARGGGEHVQKFHGQEFRARATQGAVQFCSLLIGIICSSATDVNLSK